MSKHRAPRLRVLGIPLATWKRWGHWMFWGHPPGTGKNCPQCAWQAGAA